MTRSRIPLLLALVLIAGGALAQNPPLLRAPLQAPAGAPGTANPQPYPQVVPRAVTSPSPNQANRTDGWSVDDVAFGPFGVSRGQSRARPS